MNPTCTQVITAKELGELLNFFSTTQYRLKDTDKRTTQIEDICIRLMSRDYENLIVIPNDKGQLSTSYPSKIVIPEIENIEQFSGSNTSIILDQVPYEDEIETSKLSNGNANKREKKKFDVKRLRDLISKARVARCRARFPIPAILFRDKYICRSATLSSAAEIFGRSVLNYTFNDTDNNENIETYDDDDFVKARIESSPPAPHTLNISDSTKLFSHFRNQDIKLLKYFSVKLICDLMLEKKKVKFGLNVTSSEKADKKNRYSDFNILSLPYPGCEFFKEYRDNSYCGEGLIYDWNQDFVDAEFGLANYDEVSKILNLNFKEYRSWDVIRLTQNYIKLMLYFLKEFDSSILIHCISGWDRTPLFISLLRLTLWADGEIHKNLNAVEITYLTVAYDWLLFGHNLNDRLNKGEEIMFFCFQFLKFITGDDFSINHETNNPYNDNNNFQSNRKISTESFSNYDYDFIIENIPNSSYKESSTSLNSRQNCSLTKQDSFSLVSAIEIETSVKNPKNDSDNDSLYNQVHNGNCNDEKETINEEMISTLTLEDSFITSNNFGSNNNVESFELNNINDLHSSTKPVEIPNTKNTNSIQNNSDNSLCRSESWQFVSDASSIIDNHFLNQYSSPDSLSSLKNKSTSPINYFSNNQTSIISDKKIKNSRRKDRLLEVRSLFNSAYTSINFNQNNGCTLTNFVDHIYRTVNI